MEEVATELGNLPITKSVEERILALEEKIKNFEDCCYNYKFDKLMQHILTVEAGNDKLYNYKNLNYLLKNLDFISNNINFDDGGKIRSRFMDIFNYMLRVDYAIDYELCEKFIEFVLQHNCFGGGTKNIGLNRLKERVSEAEYRGKSYENIKKSIEKHSDGKTKKRSRKKRRKSNKKK